MKKITAFQITSLTATGFKCFGEPAAFSFGEITHVTAANGKGKSSIADAIAYAFTGTAYYGDRGLDRLQNDGCREMEVCVSFTDGAGVEHSLTRARRRGSTFITLDGLELRQCDMAAVFGERDLFLSVLNPLYFIDVLGEGGKALLEKLLPAVGHEEVLAALPEPSRELLRGESLHSPETYIKSRRAEIREFEEALISYRGQKELLEHQIEERSSGLSGLESRLSSIKADIADLESLRDMDRDPGADDRLLSELREQRDKLLADNRDHAADQEIAALSREISTLEADISRRSAEPYISSYTHEIIASESKLTALYAEHKALSDTIGRIAADTKCPTCFTVMTEVEAGEVKRELGQKLAVLVVDGKRAKADLIGFKGKEDHERSVFEATKEGSLSELRSRLDLLRRQLQDLQISAELDDLGADEQVMALGSRIGELEYHAAHGNLSPEQILRLSGLEDKRRDCEAKISALNSLPVDYDFDGLISQTEADISRLTALVQGAVQYAAARADLMLAGLRMNRARIVLTEIVKTTGEVKDCFRFSYEGRDYRCLSLSEKIKAGLEVSELMKRLSGRDYPVFVDNGESVCAIDNVKPSGQVIYSRVVRGAELTVTHKQ